MEKHPPIDSKVPEKKQEALIFGDSDEPLKDNANCAKDDAKYSEEAIDNVRNKISNLVRKEELASSSPNIFSINLKERGIKKTLNPLAVKTEGSLAWEIARTELLAKDFLTSIKPIIDEKIEAEMAAGTLSEDEARELIDILSIKNFGFWKEIVLYFPKENKERMIATVSRFSAKEFLESSRTTKRKIAVKARGLFKKLSSFN